MSDDDKIRQFTPRKARSGFFSNKNKLAKIKNYLGFEYVKLKKDVNGISFNKKSLDDFAGELKYSISIMRELKNEIFLYEYFIPGNKLKEFMEAYIKGTIEGKIIQIEKHIQDNLA